MSKLATSYGLRFYLLTNRLPWALIVLTFILFIGFSEPLVSQTAPPSNLVSHPETVGKSEDDSDQESEGSGEKGRLVRVDAYVASLDSIGQQFVLSDLPKLLDGESRTVHVLIENRVKSRFTDVTPKTGCPCVVVKQNTLSAIDAGQGFHFELSIRPAAPEISQVIPVFGVGADGKRVKLFSIYVKSIVQPIVRFVNSTFRLEDLAKGEEVKLELNLNDRDWDLDLSKAQDLSGLFELKEIEPDKPVRKRLSLPFRGLLLAMKAGADLPNVDFSTMISFSGTHRLTGQTRDFLLPLSVAGGIKFRVFPSDISMKRGDQPQKYRFSFSLLNRSGVLVDYYNVKFVFSATSPDGLKEHLPDCSGEYSVIENKATGLVRFSVDAVFPGQIVPNSMMIQLPTLKNEGKDSPADQKVTDTYTVEVKLTNLDAE